MMHKFKIKALFIVNAYKNKYFLRYTYDSNEIHIEKLVSENKKYYLN